MIAQMMFGGDPELAVAEMSPWLDLRVPPKQVKLPEVEAQTHRRFMKTHLPVDALVFSPQAKYIYIGRDARDVTGRTGWKGTVSRSGHSGKMSAAGGRSATCRMSR